MEGYFTIKVTPLGCNICLWEEMELGEIKDLIREGKSCRSQWFTHIREWIEEDVDKEILTWIRCFGIPGHAWNILFFEFLAKTEGTYVFSDKNTLK